MRDCIIGAVKDLCINFLYYDRKGDEVLTRKRLQEAVARGEVTVEELGELFKKEVAKGLKIL